MFILNNSKEYEDFIVTTYIFSSAQSNDKKLSASCLSNFIKKNMPKKFPTLVLMNDSCEGEEPGIDKIVCVSEEILLETFIKQSDTSILTKQIRPDLTNTWRKNDEE